MWFGGAGVSKLQLSKLTPPKYMTTSPGEIVIGTLTYENLQYLSKAFSSDYLNVTYPPAAKTIAGTIVDFLYTRASTLNVNA